MSKIGTTSPDSDLALQRVIVESRGQLRQRLLTRERLVEPLSALTFLAAAIALAVLGGPVRDLDLPLALALVGLYAVATRIEFQMGSGWTDPSQLVFVPMLFLLPTAAVPLLVAAALLVARAPEYLSGKVHLNRIILRIADAWYAIWPAMLLVAAGATSPEWSDWPIYLAALTAQFGLDSATTTFRVSYGLGLAPGMVLHELRAIYLIDALLAPVGLLVAFTATETPASIIALLPLLGLIALFARERQARIENALALSSAYKGTAHLLGEVLSNSHEYTGSHSRSVVVLAHQVGVALGLDEAKMREVEFGALLHDVGKMAVPNEIINKPAALTPEEMAVMRSHTIEGEQMLERIGGVLSEVGDVVRSHHEFFDGSGYPDGLAGEQIPIASRVISCCDAFNAMTTHRPYRAAMPLEDAIREVRAHAGTQFDPKVVEALVEIVEHWDAIDPGPPQNPEQELDALRESAAAS